MAKKPDKKAAAKLASRSPTIANRKARHDYEILDTLECGIALVGSEVKSLRDGRAVLGEAYALVDREGNLILHNLQIDGYFHAGVTNNHDPLRPRRLLAKKKQIRELATASREIGTSLIPLSLYWKDGRAKIELAIGRGKKAADKRETLKRKTEQREMQQAMKRRF